MTRYCRGRLKVLTTLLLATRDSLQMIISVSACAFGHCLRRDCLDS